MESIKAKNCESTEGPVGSSLVTTSSLPTGIVQLSHSAAAVLPLGPISGPGSGCLLPLSIINPAQVSTMHHQPITTEPLLLVPASALSLATTSNLSLPNSLLNTKVHPSTSLQYGQQLLLNNGQLPLVLKPPVSAIQLSQPHQAQAGSQSIIVLPLGTNENNLEAKEKNSDMKNRPENVSADSTYQQNQAKKWRIAHRKNKRKRRTISAICSLREKLKTRSNSSSEIDAIISPNTGVSNTQIESEPNDVLNDKIKNTEISQIISSLPPGWHVIGFTGLDQFGSALPTPLIPTTTASNHFQMSPLTFTNSSCLKAPEIKPSLVSVNLNNTSHPVASEAYDNCAVNDLTCSVKLDDIPCTHVISIKTECAEEEKAKPDSTSDEQTVKRTKDRVSNQRKSRGNSSDHQSEKSRHVIPVTKLDKKATVEMGNSCHIIPTSYSHNSSAILKSVSSEEQWTIIGVTSIPALPVSNVQSQSQAQFGTATVTSSSSDSNPRKTQNSEQSLDTIILKIPLCPTSMTPASPRQRRRKANKTSITKHSQTASVASLLQSANAKGYSNRDTHDSSKPEEMKWTIVGLTQSSLDHNDGSIAGQHMLEHKNPPVLSYRADLTGIAKAGVKPSKASAEHVLNSNLFNFVSPIQSANPFLIQSTFNPNRAALEIENQSISKSCETVRNAGVSSNPDLFGLNPSQSQWKVVGVAPLGVPAASVTPFSSLAQLGPLSPVVPVPFLIPTASNVPLPCMGTISSCKSTMASTVTSSVSSSASTTSSDCPIISLQEALSSSNPVMLSTAPSARFTSTSASDIQTLQNLANQHSLDQIIQNNLANFQNPINVLKINEANQWNVVGVVANNQVSLINTRNTSNHGNIDQDLISDESPQDLSMKPTSTHSKAKDFSIGEDQKINDTVKNSSIRQSLASTPKSSEPESKVYQFKCKDMIKRQQESAHMKKNTVSSLLRLKRMQKGVKENGDSEDGDHSLESSAEVYETSFESEPSKSKTRSLRSYAGNRSLFTKTHPKDGLEKISLRSGTQVPILDYKSSEDDEMVSMTSQNEHSQFSPLVFSETEEQKQCESATVKVAAHSAARKRKLKVPRRMVVADLDYHPFDSSSDSN